MTADDAPPTPDNDPDEGELQRRAFADEFGMLWESRGFSPMDGRVVGYLLVMTEPYVSSARLALALGASAGSVSMATRRMLEVGYIRRHNIPGDRSHYFQSAYDPWGGTLDQSLNYFARMRALMDRALSFTDRNNKDTRNRLALSREHMIWLADTQRRWIDEWEAHKAELELDDD